MRVATKTPLEQLPTVLAAICAVEAELGSRGRVLFRSSGTKMKARVMIEGEDAVSIRTQAQHIADVLVAALAA